MKYRFMRVLPLGVVGVLAFTIPSASATTGSANAASVSGSITFYDNVNFGGEFAIVRDGARQGDFNFLQGSRLNHMNDRVSSIRNDSDSSWAIYKDKQYTGECFTLEVNQVVVDMRNPNVTWNDAVSSARPGRC